MKLSISEIVKEDNVQSFYELTPIQKRQIALCLLDDDALTYVINDKCDNYNVDIISAALTQDLNLKAESTLCNVLVDLIINEFKSTIEEEIHNHIDSLEQTEFSNLCEEVGYRKAQAIFQQKEWMGA